MTAPRLEIDLRKIRHNARTLVEFLKGRGISVTGVTKATLGSPTIANEFLAAGVRVIGDSRIENLESMRRAGIRAPMTLIRSPMLSQARSVVAHADMSLNTELDVISELSLAARKAGRQHGVLLMVELGDLREGIMPAELSDTVRHVLRLRNITLRGIGTNLACRSGVAPDDRNMCELSELATSLERAFGVPVPTVSGGNSANLRWVLSGADTGRVNDLRLGESILLGREPLRREAIEGLHSDAITLVTEVIESRIKPSQPWGELAQTALGGTHPIAEHGDILQLILAIGHQDTDICGLRPPPGVRVLGHSSDHLVVESDLGHLTVGAEVRFQLNYGALLRAMTSPYVRKVREPGLNPLDASAPA